MTFAELMVPLLSYLICGTVCALASLRSDEPDRERCVWALALALAFSGPPLVAGMVDFLNPVEDLHGHIETTTLVLGLASMGSWLHAFGYGFRLMSRHSVVS